MELLKNLEGLSADEQMTAVVELQKAAMKHLEEQKQASIGKSAELVIQGLKKIKSDFEAKFDSLNYDIQTKVASLKDGEQGLQGPKGDQGERGLDGSNGRDGRDGKDGKDGIDGVDGVGVRDAKIDFDGSLVISLTDGREINCGEVVSVDVAKQIQKVTHNIQTGAGGDSQTVLDAIAAIQATIATYGTMATQNKTSVDIEGGTIDNTTIGATTPSTGVFTTLVSTGNITYFGGAIGSDVLRIYKNNTIAGGTSTETSPAFSFIPKQSNFGASLVGLGENPRINTVGSDGFYFTTLSSIGYSGFTQLKVAHTASAVNYVQVTGAATGGSPAITAQGSDTNVGITVQGKGTGSAILQANSTGNALLATDGGLTAVRAIPRGSSGDTWLDVQRTSGLVALSAASGVTNGAFLVQSKGTGAIDLAAGSSGVNISNGGTVTALTRSVSAFNYTSQPSVVISAPTTAGGVQATATQLMYINTAPVTAGGTGYTVGNILTVVGGTPFTTAATLTVSAVSAGVITAVTSTNFNSYSVLPSSPVSVTGGTGTGATFSPQWGNGSLVITNAGSGYVEQPTVTFSGGGGSGAAAYATVGSGTVVKSIGSTMSFSTPNGESFRVTDQGVTSANYASVRANSTGNSPFFLAQGSDTNVGLAFFTKGTGSLVFGTNSGVTQAVVSHTASAVNYVQVTGAATTGYPIISAQGSDSSAGLILQTKGSGYVRFSTGGGPNSDQLRVNHTANPVNYAQITGAAAGASPVFSVAGSDTNISLVLQPKGTGALQAQQTDSTATGGNARGANAVDWQTLRNGAGQVASGQNSFIGGGGYSTAAGAYSSVVTGFSNTANATVACVLSGQSNVVVGNYAVIAGGVSNAASGWLNFIGGGFTNSGTANAAVTTQSATMNGTTAVTLSGSNASIKVGQYITGTSIAADTYVAAISATSLTLSKVASGSSTSTLSFYTPHGVVVGGGNNQATGAYSFIGGGGDAGTAANRNVASGDWSFVGGGVKNTASGLGSAVVGGGIFTAGSYFANTASGISSFVGGGTNNSASGTYSSIVGGLSNSTTGSQSFIYGGDGSVASGTASTVLSGIKATTRGIIGNAVFGAGAPVSLNIGAAQSALLILNQETTNATATVLTSNTLGASTNNQVILPNNSAYYFRGEVVSGVTGGGNTKGWFIEGVIKRGANAASTALVGTPTVTSNYADAGASTWTIAVTADTTNGGLAVTFTGQAATTIRTVAQIRTTEMTY